jgi:hypothetical protein
VSTDKAAEAMRVIGRVIDRKMPLVQPVRCECGLAFGTWEGMALHKLLHARGIKT